MSTYRLSVPGVDMGLLWNAATEVPWPSIANPSMERRGDANVTLKDLHHVAIRVRPGKLEESREFYAKILGMSHADRPNLGFPGAWLSATSTMIHLVDEARPPKADAWYCRPEASSAVDHIALKARGFDAMKRRIEAAGLDWRQTTLPDAGLWQLFVLDPSGIIIELNFDIADEPQDSIGPDASRRYPPILHHVGLSPEHRGGERSARWERKP